MASNLKIQLVEEDRNSSGDTWDRSETYTFPAGYFRDQVVPDRLILLIQAGGGGGKGGAGNGGGAGGAAFVIINTSSNLLSSDRKRYNLRLGDRGNYGA